MALPWLGLILASSLSGCGKPEPDRRQSQQTASSAPPPGATEDCDQLYAEFVARHPVNFAECVPTPPTAPVCDGAGGGVAATGLDVLILLDASGSMAGNVPGGSKIDIAKAAISRFAAALPAGANVGLIVYGHKGTNQPAGKAASCAGVETIYPPGPLNASRFGGAVAGFRPTGYTPLAATLGQARDGLTHATSAGGHKRLVYLVSDGIETCGGDPVAAARALNAQDIGAIVDIVGFDVDNAGQAQLRAAAKADGGTYIDARSVDDLNRAFDEERRRRIDALVGQRNCLSDAASESWFRQHQGTFNSYICMREKRNTVWLGVRADRAALAQEPEPRRACAARIDARNDAWSKEMDARIEEMQAALKARGDTTYAELRRQADAIEAEHQKLLR